MSKGTMREEGKKRIPAFLRKVQEADNTHRSGTDFKLQYVRIICVYIKCTRLCHPHNLCGQFSSTEDYPWENPKIAYSIYCHASDKANTFLSFFPFPISVLPFLNSKHSLLNAHRLQRKYTEILQPYFHLFHQTTRRQKTLIQS